MNQCYGCTTCESADKPLEGFIKNLPLETSHHRVEGQSTKCAFGLQGVCCRLCSNGPCRITPDAPRGICGANADTIVARNFLRAVASGSGCVYPCRREYGKKCEKCSAEKEWDKGEGALINWRLFCRLKKRICYAGSRESCRCGSCGVCIFPNMRK